MPISSLVIKVKPEQQSRVKDKINSFNEATVTEVHNNDLIVITETDQREQDRILWSNLEKIEGVIKCDLVYYNFEDAKESDYE